MFRRKQIARGIVFLAVLSIVGLLTRQVHADPIDFSGHGVGTESQPYRIEDCNQLQEMSEDLTAHYVLVNSIDCSGTSGWNSGAGFDPIGSLANSFTGSFDGRNYNIDGLTMQRPARDYAGLFGHTYQATIKNVKLTGTSITARSFTGMLFGGASSTDIDHVSIEGEVNGEFSIGGLGGRADEHSTINGAVVTSVVTASNVYTGGVVGVAGDTDFANIYADVTATSGGHIGGLIGNAFAGSRDVAFSNIYVTGTITANGAHGGIIGILDTTSHAASFENIAIDVQGANFALYTNFSSPVQPVTRTQVYYNAHAATSHPTSCYAYAEDGCTAVNSDGSASTYFDTYGNAPFTSWDFTSVWQDDAGVLKLRDASVDALPSFSAPANPSFTLVTPASTSIHLEWMPANIDNWGGDPILGYRFSYSPAGEDDWTDVDLDRSITSYDMTSLPVGQRYDISITAYNEHGYGASQLMNNVGMADPNISSCEDLQNISEDPGASYVLTQDISCTGTYDENSPDAGALYHNGEGFIPIEDFTGTLDGAGHSISDLTINRPGSTEQGLFGQMFQGAYVHDLTLTAVNITGESSVGGLAGRGTGDTVVDNVDVSGIVEAEAGAGLVVGNIDADSGSEFTINDVNTIGSVNVLSGASQPSGLGGVVGSIYANVGHGFIADTFAAVTISDNDLRSAGGIVGGLSLYEDSTFDISDTGSQGTITASASAGGLIGRYFATRDGATPQIHISDSSSIAAVTAQTDGMAGGLVGEMEIEYGGELQVSGSYFDGSVTVNGGDGAGGIIGQAYQTSNGDIDIEGTFAHGPVTNTAANGAGGLIGWADLAVDLRDSYAEVDVQSVGYAGGLIGGVQGFTIEDTYAVGTVTTDSGPVGGLAGWVGSGWLNDSFAANAITTTSGYKAGLIGSIQNNSLADGSGNNYFDSYVTGQVDCYNDNDSGLPVSDGTCTMVNLDEEGTPSDPDYFIANSQNDPMSNWDFIDRWGTTSADEYGYPVLQANPQYEPLHEMDYTIDSCRDLQDMRYDLAGNYTVVNDITDCYLSGNYNAGDGFEPIGNDSTPFTGTLDGNSYTIYGPTVWRPDDNDVGLFGVTSGANLHSIKLYNEANAVGNHNVGLIAGRMINGTISGVDIYEQANGSSNVGGLVGEAECSATGELLIEDAINWSNVYVAEYSGGGLVGSINNSDSECTVTIRNSKNYGEVSRNWNDNGGAEMGGIVGTVSAAGGPITLSGLYSTANVYGRHGAAGGIIGYQSTSNGSPIPEIIHANADSVYVELESDGGGAGGIIGEADGPTRIIQSKANGDVYGAYGVGGLVGQLYGSDNGVDIQESYANVEIGQTSSEDTPEDFGGLVGYGNQITILNSYSTSNVAAPDANYVGGLVGIMQGDVVNSYATGSVQADNYVGGLLGYYETTTSAEQYGVQKNFASGPVEGNGAYQAGMFGFLNTITADIYENHYTTDLTSQDDCFVDAFGDPFDVSGVCEEHTEPNYFIDNNTHKPFIITEDGWDFDTIWSTTPEDYPRLRWDYTRPVAVITNCQELQAMRYDLDANYSLSGPIDCSETNDWNSGDGFIPVGDNDEAFTGSFEGNGYPITDLFINNYSQYTGLFGHTENAVISDFALHGTITGRDDEAGGVTGLMSGGSLTDVDVNTLVVGEDISGVGGAVGRAECNEDGGTLTIENVFSTGNTLFTSGWGFGGLVGYMYAGGGCDAVVRDSSATGDVSYFNEDGDVEGDAVGGLIGEFDCYDSSQARIVNGFTGGIVSGAASNVGGLVGYMYNDCESPEQLLVTSSSAVESAVFGSENTDTSGGLVGTLGQGRIQDSYAVALVVGGSQTGGLVGSVYGNDSVNIERAFAEGAVTSEGSSQNVGGLIGSVTGSKVRDTYADVAIESYNNNIGGLIGYLDGDLSTSYSSSTIMANDEGYTIGGLVGVYAGTSTTEQAGLLHNFSATDFLFTPGNTIGMGGIYGYYNSPSEPNNLGTNYYDSDLVDTNACGFTYPVDPAFCPTTDAASFQSSSTNPPFAGDGQNWDFDAIWEVRVDDYPALRLQGAAQEPNYEITTCDELQNIDADLTGNYLLMNDIDCSGSMDMNDGDGFSSIGRGEGLVFTGTLDGQGHSINQLVINMGQANNVGLFGHAENATISNLTINGITIGADATGSIVGFAFGGVVLDRVGSSMEVIAESRSGGLVGESEGTISLTDTYNQGMVLGSQNLGGLLGYTDDEALIYNSYNSGNISGMGDIGGLAGKIEYGVIDSSFNAGWVEAGNDHYGILDNGGEIYFLNNYLDAERSGIDNCIGNIGNEECNLVNTYETPSPDYFYNNNSNAPLDNWDFDGIWRSHRATFPTFGVPVQYTISDCSQLRDIENDLDGYYELNQNIDCSDTVNWNEGQGWLGIGQDSGFTGTLDGHGYTISGLHIETEGNDPRGLFATVAGGEIRNLTIQDAAMLTDYCTGAVAGRADGIDIYKVTATAAIQGEFAGGLIGCNWSSSGRPGVISDSNFTGSIQGNSGGGIIGDNNTNSGSTLSIIRTGSDGFVQNSENCGGLIGSLYHEWDGVAPRQGIEVDSSYSDMSMSCSENAGGLIGSVTSNGLDFNLTASHFSGSIDNNDGNVSGGLIGYLESDGHSPYMNIDQSYVEGTIANGGVDVGGLIGLVGNYYRLYVGNSYVKADITFSGDNGGGLVGRSDGLIEFFRVYSAGTIANVSQIATEYSRWVGGMVGSSEATYITASFTVMDVAGIESDPGSYNGVIGFVEYEDLTLYNVYYNQDTATGFCTGDHIVYIEDENCQGVSLNDNPTIYIANHTDAPLDSWNTFGEIWHIRANDYPSLSPAIEPQVQCEEVAPTSTTLHVACSFFTIDNKLYGPTTWEMRYHKLNTDDWQTVDLPLQSYFDTTLTGLQPSTWYDIQFRHTDDRGVSEWYHIEAETLSAGSSGSSSSSSTTSSTKKAKVRTAFSTNTTPEVVTDQEQKITLNDYADYISDIGKNLDLKPGQVVYFTVNGVEHTATVKEIGDGYIIIMLASDMPFDVRLLIGQSGQYDVTGDGQPDIEIRYDGTQDGLAHLNFRQVSTPVGATTKPQVLVKRPVNWFAWFMFAVSALLIILAARSQYVQRRAAKK